MEKELPKKPFLSLSWINELVDTVITCYRGERSQQSTVMLHVSKTVQSDLYRGKLRLH